MTKPIVRIDDLAVARGGLRILQGLSFDVRPGDLIVLRGPNGIGKTSLLRTLAGLQRVDQGSIAAEPEVMAYAAHADGLKATLSVAENLTFWAGIFGQGDIDAAVATFDLEPLLERPAHALSAGQKRRLGLARLMVTARPLWLLDEPTVSLDVTANGQFADMLRQHLSAGGAAIAATHIDIGIEGRLLELGEFRATIQKHGAFDEALA